MRISDWSSDVCSSDLLAERKQTLRLAQRLPAGGIIMLVVAALLLTGQRHVFLGIFVRLGEGPGRGRPEAFVECRHCGRFGGPFVGKIGRASCRESVCQYV